MESLGAKSKGERERERERGLKKKLVTPWGFERAWGEGIWGDYGESEKQRLKTSKSSSWRHSKYVHCEPCIFSFWILFCWMSL